MFLRGSMLLVLAGAAGIASAQEMPYFITYTHHMEEPGSLEVAVNPVIGVPKGGATAFAPHWLAEPKLAASGPPSLRFGATAFAPCWLAEPKRP